MTHHVNEPSSARNAAPITSETPAGAGRGLTNQPARESRSLERFMLAAMPATCLALGGFLLMNQMIRVDEVHLSKAEQRVLERVSMPDAEVPPTRFAKPVLQDAPTPPPTPLVSRAETDPGIISPVPYEAPVYSVRPARVLPVKLGEMSTVDRAPVPIRPPLPVYPDRQAARGVEGKCDVRFDINARGQPFNVAATCTDAGFVKSAERAVKKAEFAPKISGGIAVERRNVIWPLTYNLNQ